MEYKLVSYEDERVAFNINEANEMKVIYKVHSDDPEQIKYDLMFSSLIVKEICKALNNLNSNQPERLNPETPQGDAIV
jgi:hypothetical protein